MTYLAISIGAVFGANARYLVGGWISDRFGSSFPYGTLVINVSGSLAIGFILTLISEQVVAPWWWRPAFAVGFLGAYTTFSTFTYETLTLLNQGSFFLAFANVVSSAGIGLAAVFAGATLARLV